VLQVNIAEIAELRREVDDLRIPTTQHLHLPPQQQEHQDINALLSAMAAMEETISGIRRDMKVEQDDQERRADTTQLTLSLLRTDLSALKLSHEESLLERQQPTLTDKLTNDTSKESVQMVSVAQDSLRKNVLQEFSLIREELEKDRLVCRRQFAAMRERVEACERVELEAGQDCLSEPMLLRGRVEALMSSRSGQKDLAALANLGTEKAKNYPADLMAFIDKLQDVDRPRAHSFPNVYQSGNNELVALNNDMATLRRRLEHVEQESALKVDGLLMRVDAVDSLTCQSRDGGMVSRRVRDIEANQAKLQVELNSHMRSLDLDLHKKVLAEIDTKITKELRRLDISQIGPRIAHLEKEVSRHSVLFPCVR
jgi:hypothetical protein